MTQDALLANGILGVLALAFALMGLVAFTAPVWVTRQFDIPTLSAAGRNEVRAVYGGFGLMMAAMLVIALTAPALRAGIAATVGAALAGMAAGRLISAALDRGIGRFPALYLCIETVGAALLFIYAV